MKKYFNLIVLLLISVLLFSSCADVENVQACLVGHTYGFWGGVWHGGTVGFAFIGQLFSHDIAMYAVNNNGGWYDFGFFLGLAGFLWFLFRMGAAFLVAVFK